MRNDYINPKKILSLTAPSPFFRRTHLTPLGEDKPYMKIRLSRLAKREEMIRLKKAMYVAKLGIDAAEKGAPFSDYVEWLANALYLLSYLSLDYILYVHNLLTEAPKNITSCSR